MSLTAYGQRFDVGFDDGFALAPEDAANGVLQLFVLDAQGFLGSTQQDDVGRAGYASVLGLLFDVEHDDMRQLAQVGLDDLDVRIVGYVDERRR